jgi:hypothetical protein
MSKIMIHLDLVWLSIAFIYWSVIKPIFYSLSSWASLTIYFKRFTWLTIDTGKYIYKKTVPLFFINQTLQMNCDECLQKCHWSTDLFIVHACEVNYKIERNHVKMLSYFDFNFFTHNDYVLGWALSHFGYVRIQRIFL